MLNQVKTFFQRFARRVNLSRINPSALPSTYRDMPQWRVRVNAFGLLITSPVTFIVISVQDNWGEIVTAWNQLIAATFLPWDE